MANLKEIRSRIASVSSTMQITSAMKMVSAAKLKKAQDAVARTRPYAEQITKLLTKLCTTAETEFKNQYTEQRNEKHILIVAITSNRGLCGPFNTNVIKQTQHLIKHTHANKTVSVLTIGKKANEALSKKAQVIADKSTIYDQITFQKVSEIATTLTAAFTDRTYDKIELVYNKFKNAATQQVITEPFLPIITPQKKDDNTTNYIFEPSKTQLINQLIPQSLNAQLYQAIQNTSAGEHGARMTAMHKATDNASALQDQLKLNYNKARQAAITSEILEIVGGAEALDN